MQMVLLLSDVRLKLSRHLLEDLQYSIACCFSVQAGLQIVNMGKKKKVTFTLFSLKLPQLLRHFLQAKGKWLSVTARRVM